MKEGEVVTWFPYVVIRPVLKRGQRSHLTERVNLLRKFPRYFEIYRYMYPNFGELMQFFVISREASVIGY